MNWQGEDRFSFKDVDQKGELRHYFEFKPERGDFGIVAEANGLIIGVVWLLFFGSEDKGYGFISDGVPELSISVWPGYRGQGVGELLMNAAINEARSRGSSCVSLSVEAGNPAVNLYLRFGFTPASAHAEGTFVLHL